MSWPTQPEMNPYRWEQLATYNAERARGIKHTKEWRKRMEREQQAFSEQQAEASGLRLEHLTDVPPQP